MDTKERIAGLNDFWTREFAYYLNEHRHPLNRVTHMVGIPLLLMTALGGFAWLPFDWRAGLLLVVGGQLVGWAIQIIGHRIEGNKPALLERKISFLMGPLMVFVELLELAGVRFVFVKRARQVVFGTSGETAEAH